MKLQNEVLIIGGGLAGLTAAIHLSSVTSSLVASLVVSPDNLL